MSVADIRAGIDCADAYAGISLQRPARRDRAEELIDTLGAIDADLASSEAGLRLGPAIEQLTPRECTILRLRFVQELYQSEIAERIGVSQMQVSRLLKQTLTKMRKNLADTHWRAASGYDRTRTGKENARVTPPDKTEPAGTASRSRGLGVLPVSV